MSKILEKRAAKIDDAKEIMLDYTLRVSTFLKESQDKDFLTEEHQKLVQAVHNCVVLLSNSQIEDLNKVLHEAKERIQNLERELFELKNGKNDN